MKTGKMVFASLLMAQATELAAQDSAERVFKLKAVPRAAAISAAAGEGGGNPDETFKTRRLDFETVISMDERVEMLKKMQLPEAVYEMFLLLQRENSSLDTSTNIRTITSTTTDFFIADYDVINGGKVRSSVSSPQPYTAEDNVRFAETPAGGVQIWYPAGLNRPKEEIFLTLLHELVRSSPTRSGAFGVARGAGATPFVNELDGHFRTLLLSEDLEAQKHARSEIERIFDVKTMRQLADESVSKYTREKGCPAIVLNGSEVARRNFGSRPSYASNRSWRKLLQGSPYGRSYPFYVSSKLREMQAKMCFERVLRDVFDFQKRAPNQFEMARGKGFAEIVYVSDLLAREDVFGLNDGWVIRFYKSKSDRATGTSIVNLETGDSYPVEQWYIKEVEWDEYFETWTIYGGASVFFENEMTVAKELVPYSQVSKIGLSFYKSTSTFMLMPFLDFYAGHGFRVQSDAIDELSYDTTLRPVFFPARDD